MELKEFAENLQNRILDMMEETGDEINGNRIMDYIEELIGEKGK